MLNQLNGILKTVQDNEISRFEDEEFDQIARRIRHQG